MDLNLPGDSKLNVSGCFAVLEADWAELAFFFLGRTGLGRTGPILDKLDWAADWAGLDWAELDWAWANWTCWTSELGF